MGRQTIQELARGLAKKNGLKVREAEAFAVAMFDVIRHALEADGQVKVKGLGTFKIIGVEARESINIHTGERVTIESHGKITFTPDATMKELVNKPFSQFETVVLNDGVSFDDLPAETDKEKATPQVKPETVGLVAVDVPQPPVENEKPEAAKEEEVEAPAAVVEQEKDEKMVSVQTEPLYIEDDERPSFHWLLFAMVTLLLMTLSAYGGYWYGRQSVLGRQVPMAVPTDTAQVVVEDSLEQVPDSLSPTMEDSVIHLAQPQSAVVEEPTHTQKPPTFDSEKYERMDARVRTGAYRIVGTDREVKVHAGETLYRISRRELGEGMECYIQVYNDLSDNAELKEGQMLKIPKLEWKKKRKAQ